jgi:hypothetical protein
MTPMLLRVLIERHHLIPVPVDQPRWVFKPEARKKNLEAFSFSLKKTIFL